MGILMTDRKRNFSARVGFCIALALMTMLAGCSEDTFDAVKFQRDHCAAATRWYGAAEGKISVIDVRDAIRQDERTITVTHDQETRDDGPFGGNRIRLWFTCGYQAQGPRDDVVRARWMAYQGRKLSPDVVEAMNMRIGLLGGLGGQGN